MIGSKIIIISFIYVIILEVIGKMKKIEISLVEDQIQRTKHCINKE